jgi:LuxR family transcriptional regulator, regulator of acetate metabolism
MLLRSALADLAQSTRFPIVFGGFTRGDRIVVTELVGNRRDTLRGLVVSTGCGLGGRVLQEGRPRLTPDYGAARTITHDYDRPVLAEGITALFAIPVTVGPSIGAVLYGGLRTSLSIGGVSIDPAMAVARELAGRLAGRARAAHGAGARHDHGDDTLGSPGGLQAAEVEELRRLYADVRGIAVDTADPRLRDRLEALERRIAGLVNGGARAGGTSPPHGRLTARESDVLSLVALGYTNAAIGRTIGVTEATVKSYMNSAMHKLGATTRYEAVAVARRLRLMP